MERQTQSSISDANQCDQPGAPPFVRRGGQRVGDFDVAVAFVPPASCRRFFGTFGFVGARYIVPGKPAWRDVTHPSRTPANFSDVIRSLERVHDVDRGVHLEGLAIHQRRFVLPFFHRAHRDISPHRALAPWFGDDHFLIRRPHLFEEISERPVVFRVQ